MTDTGPRPQQTTGEDADGTRAATTPDPLPMLTEPSGGVPDVIESQEALADAVRLIAAQPGAPVAIDAERASGYRYGQRAYLVQLRRGDAGIHLIDPVAVPDLTPLVEVLRDVEWEVHAATQDIPCLADIGLHPARLFDTELGARLAGLPRVGLGAVVEHYLGVTLAKEHSAVDWSERPLPRSWLQYAALDVEVLHEVRTGLEADLRRQGKLEWALQEFDALTRFQAPAPRTDPWRRTSGMHRVRGRRALAAVRALWESRDAVAQARDDAPGRVLPDAYIVDLAQRQPQQAGDLVNPAGATQTGRSRRPHPGLNRHAQVWLDAVALARGLPEAALPEPRVVGDSLPPHRVWGERNPAAAERLATTRQALAEISERLTIPVENLMTPDTLRRVLWAPPSDGDTDAAFADLGARPWQIDLVGPVVKDAVREHPDA